MATDQRVVVRLPSGVEYGLKDATTAKRVYPNATVVRYQDGRTYDGDDAADAPSLDDSRATLNRYALSVGVDDPDTLPNKQAVMDAIAAHQGGAA